MQKSFKVVPSLDLTDLNVANEVIHKIDNHSLIYGYKIGFSLGLLYGLPKVVKTLRKVSKKPLIYDHQKAGTDIPDTALTFAKVIADSGIDEVIVFGHAGPETLNSWIDACNQLKLKTIVGGLMTHSKFLISEGGFVSDDAIEKIYTTAVKKGINSFVVPLTKPDMVMKLVTRVEFPQNSEFFSPGYGVQGGILKDFCNIKNHFFIIGRSLINSPDPLSFLNEFSQKLEDLK